MSGLYDDRNLDQLCAVVEATDAAMVAVAMHYGWSEAYDVDDDPEGLRDSMDAAMTALAADGWLNFNRYHKT
jgi:hypothetical protein